MTPMVEDVRRELQIRRFQRDLPLFCRAMLLRDGFRPALHHRLLTRELAAVASGAVRRLMVLMPPGSAKSTYASVLFPAWFLAGGPARTAVNVLAASHTTALADSFGRRVRAVARDEWRLGWSPVGEGSSAWGTSGGGCYRAAGVGTGIAGFRADLGIIDDPVRSRADAESAVLRERSWQWYRADFLTRLRPGARQVLVMTRWHEDDLAGRLLATQAEAWRVVRLPAMAEADDPLGRPPGAVLWDDDSYGYGAQLREAHAFYQRAGANRDWCALFQQQPRPDEGALFRVERMPVIDAAPVAAAGGRVRAWDLAATAAIGTADPDWTVGVLMLRTEAGGFVVADVVRLRGGPEVVEAAIVNTAAQDGRDVAVSLPQDPGQAGKAQAEHLVRRLAGFRVRCTPESGSKATRAAPVAAQCNVGNVAVLRAPWTRAYLEELRGFPGGKDDQVDATSRAFEALAVAPERGRMMGFPFMGR